jgi:hypothetical protein
VDRAKRKPNPKAENSMDAVIEVYKRDIDRSLIRENLKLTQQERIIRFEDFMSFTFELREMGRKMREKKSANRKTVDVKRD